MNSTTRSGCAFQTCQSYTSLCFKPRLIFGVGVGVGVGVVWPTSRKPSFPRVTASARLSPWYRARRCRILHGWGALGCEDSVICGPTATSVTPAKQTCGPQRTVASASSVAPITCITISLSKEPFVSLCRCIASPSAPAYPVTMGVIAERTKNSTFAEQLIRHWRFVRL